MLPDWIKVGQRFQHTLSNKVFRIDDIDWGCYSIYTSTLRDREWVKDDWTVYVSTLRYDVTSGYTLVISDPTEVPMKVLD